jgi:hypothetical protein
MSVEDWKGEERREESESRLIVKWWCVILLFLGIFGFFFITSTNHESRITRVETKYEAVADNVGEIKQDIRDIKRLLTNNNK